MTVQIDVLMATYNGELYIEEQVKSLMDQTFQDFHLYIRDDGSTDKTLRLIRELALQYPEKISILPSKERLGVIGNFSALMTQSRAPYLMFCDQDDVWDKDKIAVTIAKMHELELSVGTHIPVLVHADARVVNQELVEIAPSFWQYAALDPVKCQTLNRLIVQNNVTGCCMMINRAVKERALPIPTEAVMHDWWLALVASGFGCVGCVERPLMSYRQHANNVVGAKKFSLWNQGLAFYKRSQAINIRKYQQTKTFYNRYEASLDGQARQLLQVYLNLKYTPWFKGKWLTFKYRFIKNGWLRGMAWFACMRQP